MEWFIGLFVANWAQIAGVLAALVLVFDRIAKITPTQSDDALLTVVYKISAVLGLRVQDNPGKVTPPAAPAAPAKVDRAVK